MAKDGKMRTLSLRAIFLIGFVIAMPVLALPAVARRLDDWLYGPPPIEAASSTPRSDLQQAIQPRLAEQESPASFDEIEPSVARRLPHEGLDAALPSPPPLAPLPAFPPLAQQAPADSHEIGPLDAAAAARLAQIRQELERLGAETMLLDTSEGSGDYRFHCQMREDARSLRMRDFEATTADPLAAAEQVLAEVSAWRMAARTPNTRQE